MASTNKTSLGLNKWVMGDSPKLADFNQDNRIIDEEFAKIREWARGTFSNPNLLINGNFQVWQRGTSFESRTDIYSVDRWILITGEDSK